MQPNPIAETSSPLLPSFLFSTLFSFSATDFYGPDRQHYLAVFSALTRQAPKPPEPNLRQSKMLSTVIPKIGRQNPNYAKRSVLFANHAKLRLQLAAPPELSFDGR